MVVCVLTTLVLPGAVGADRVQQLRARSTALATVERSAVLELYAIESRLDRARGDLAAIESRQSAVRRDLATARRQLRVARRTLELAEHRLGSELRALYARDGLDALAIILGSTSFDEMLTELDSLDRAVRSAHSAVEQTEQARGSAVRLRESLDRRNRELGRLRAAAAAGVESLSAARDDRTTYIGHLRAERSFDARQIASLEQRARTAEAVATVATMKAVSSRSPSSSSESPAATQPAPPETTTPSQPPVRSGRQLTVIATAYSLPGSTASGLPVGPGVVAVDPAVIPLGTRMSVPGYGEGIAADTGSAIKGLRIDLWFPTLQQARDWGAQTVTITLH